MFIGSPGGLEEERKRFAVLLEKYSKLHGEPASVVFHPVGWEDTLGGVGRPQELINKDLEPCDFAVFIFHDRWGTPTGSGKSSGTEEELELAEKLYAETRLRNIVLFFKKVSERQLRDPGDQLKKVLEFRTRIEREKKYLFQQFAGPDDFCDAVEAHLVRWQGDHGATGKEFASAPADTISHGGKENAGRKPPSFGFWIAEAERLLKGTNADTAAAMFCAQKAVDISASKLEWARATNLVGHAQFFVDPAAAYRSINLVIDRFNAASTLDEKEWLARALYNKGVALGALNRSEEEIAAYDEVAARFGTAEEAALKEQVAMALFNKGFALGALNRGEEAIAAYDEVVARFGTAEEAALKEQVAKALFNKGFRLGALNRSEEEIAAYDEVAARFGTAEEAALKEQVAMALFNKGFRLGALNRSEEAIAAYDEVAARFGTAEEAQLRVAVAWAKKALMKLKRKSKKNESRKK